MVKDFLVADKKIYDSVHGFIPFDEFEKELIDSLPFQRLHYVHQLGIAYLVYPGATHTRFEHAIGTMTLATLILEKICKTTRTDVFHFVPRKGSSDYLYWRRVLRMAALCHDLGRLPFSDVAEKDLLGSLGHEHWTLKIIDSPYLKAVWDKLRQAPAYLEEVVERDIVEDIKKIAVGEVKWKQAGGKAFTPWEKIVSEVINGDFFGAGRIDYLLRDAKSTGVAYGLFDYHQLIEMLRILPTPERGADELKLGIEEYGLEACEALLLSYRFMHRRIYQYSSIRAYDFHLRRFMKAIFSKKMFDSVDDFLSLSDIDVIAALNKAAKDLALTGHHDAKCIVFRKHRFRAIALSSSIGEKDLKEFKLKFKLKENDLEWEFIPAEKPLMEKLTFPVSRKAVMIQDVRECSDLLTRSSVKQSNWAYISPQFDMEFLQFLESRS